MTSGARGRAAWELGWWAPVPPALEPDELVDPAVHGALLSAVADGAPLDRLGQHRLESLKAAGLATADGRPRFPVAPASQAKAVAETAGDLGRAMARLVAGEWSRLEVEYEPLHAALSTPPPSHPARRDHPRARGRRSGWTGRRGGVRTRPRGGSTRR